MKHFHMISGLPRAGSTLLCQILNSNKNFHVTPTSGILDTLKLMRSSFSQNPTWRAQDRLKIYENFKKGMEGFLRGFFYDKKVVFDKNRAWPSNIKLLDTILEDETSKIIWLYRDPVEIISSIESQYQKTYLLENMDESAAPGAFQTLDRRIGTYASPDGIVSQPIESLKDAIEMGFASRILIVKYYDLTNDTQNTMNSIHDFIGQPRYVYDLQNVKQSTWEFDGVYNYKFLHKIREGEIKWKRGDYQFDPKFVAALNSRFSAINKLVINNDYSELLNSLPVSATEQETTSIIENKELKSGDVESEIKEIVEQVKPTPFLSPALGSFPTQ